MSYSTMINSRPVSASIWAPLEAHLKPVGCAAFMFMGKTPNGLRTIHNYKHRDSRRYLHIDELTTCYARADDEGFVPVEAAIAIRAATTV